MALSRLTDDWNLQGNVAREKFWEADGQRTFSFSQYCDRKALTNLNLQEKLLHAHACTHVRTHKHSHQGLAEESNTSNSQAPKGWHNWVQIQGPTPGLTWRMLLDHTSLGGTLTGIPKAKTACLSPALTLLGFGRKLGREDRWQEGWG